MNVKFEHRAHDLAATAVYTWAQSKDDKSAAAGVGATGSGYQGFMDNHNPQLDYGPSDFDVDQRFVASYVYQLPFGRGKRSPASVNRATDLLIGGWETTGIATFQTGFPYSINAERHRRRTQHAVAARQHGLRLQHPRKPHRRHAAHQLRLLLTAGTRPFWHTPRNFLRQPGINNWDMGMAKNFHFAERVNFKIAGDFFNAWNHHQYADQIPAL